MKLKLLFSFLLLSCYQLPSYSETYSSTSAPTSNVSGSISNVGVMNMPTRQFSNQFGSGVVCQGATLAIQPFLSANASFSRPFNNTSPEYIYSTIDANEDGDVDNPSEIIGTRHLQTGQKDSFALSPGLSLSWSIPLDRKAQSICRRLGNQQIKYWENKIADQRLSYEVARIQNCQAFLEAGVIVTGVFKQICSDVKLTNMPGVTPQHLHTIPTLEDSDAKQ